MTDPYNPLDKINLGKSVADALLEQRAHPLGQLPQFVGAGIYVIYYRGDFPAYRRLREANDQEWVVPIYVGKAIPSGGRKGLAILSDTAKGRYLYNRLQEHAESLRQSHNLDLTDFTVRSLAVDDIWIPLGETLLIETFKPVWNRVLDGFGNHDPGVGRYGGLRPMWDTLHPGRPWADKCKIRDESPEDMLRRVEAYLETPGVPKRI